nr:MAG: hypothetical protein [Tombusviridae sp.]
MASGVPTEDVIALTKWGAKWLRFAFDYAVGNGPEQVYARGLLAAFDRAPADASKFIVCRETSLTVIERASGKSVLYDGCPLLDRVSLGDGCSQVTVDDPNEGIRTFEQTDDCADSMIYEVPVPQEKILVNNKKITTRVRKGCRSRFAMSLGKRAYVKFGARPVSEANVIVTRKWLLKVIEDEFKDLRNCDKAIALDRAVFLSFIPTMSHNNFKFVFHGKNAVTSRIGGESLFSRIAHWANPAE